MATWKKVVVSGSSAELAALKVDNLNSGEVVIGGGQAANLSTRVISGSGAILASGGSGIQLTGSFSGSFTGALIGTSSWATNATTATQVANSLTQGTGVTTFTYNGSSAQTVAVSGASTLSTNAVTKWTGTAFANSSLTDNGTLITGATSIQLSGANSSLTGSFTGSFKGDGSGLTGVTAQASFPLTFGEGIGSLGPSVSSSYNGNQPVTIVVSGAVDLLDGRHVKWDNTANKFTNSLISDDGTTVTISGSNLFVTASNIVFGSASLNTTFTVTGSIRSTTGFTGSLFGTASWASNAVQVANSLTAGAGLTGTTFNGSAASTFDVGAGALITVQADAVMVTTSSLSTNQIPKFINNGFSGSNITDTGAQVQIAATATSGLLVNAGGVTVTGNSTFNNNVNIVGNLNVAGTASFTNTDSLFVADKFIALASGSTTLTQAGIIAVASTTATAMSGSALFLDNVGTVGRWAVTGSLNTTASSATNVNEYVVSVTVNQAAAPAAATKPVWGSDTNNTNAGSMWVQTNGDIYIYS